MTSYYVIPLVLTLLFAGAYLLVNICLKFFDCFNCFWDAWDKLRVNFPPLVLVEVAYFGAILYYIVYYELSGSI